MLGGSIPISRWLGSPIDYKHYKPFSWPFGREATRSLGDEKDHHGNIITYLSWDDPPSQLVVLDKKHVGRIDRSMTS